MRTIHTRGCLFGESIGEIKIGVMNTTYLTLTTSDI